MRQRWSRGLLVSAALVTACTRPGSDASPPGATEQTKLLPPGDTQVSDARALGRTFARVAEQISPSVVRISVVKPLERLELLPDMPFNRDPDELPMQQGTGSGLVIDADGHILTNNHVVDGATEVKVAFADGAEVTGKVVGSDPMGDIALVRVEGAKKLTPARFGDSDKLAVGDWVIAVGNPFGLDHSVTVGVLSAKNRSGFSTGTYEDFLQTDASINPGNSGGPLVNLDGEVVGINSAIAGIGTGIGFAVPSTAVRPIAEQLMADGVVRRPYLGVRMQDLTPAIRGALGKDAPAAGALVSQVAAGSPAAGAGLKPGDVVTSLDGETADDSRALQRLILKKPIGERVRLGLWRDGDAIEVSARTEELPTERATVRERTVDKPDDRAGGGDLGLELANLTPELARKLDLDPSVRGAVITGVRPGSPAARTNVAPGDLILEVDRRPVPSAEAAARALRPSRPAGHLVRVLRRDAAVYLVLGDR